MRGKLRLQYALGSRLITSKPMLHFPKISDFPLMSDDEIAHLLESVFEQGEDLIFNQFMIDLLANPFWMAKKKASNKLSDLILHLSKSISDSDRSEPSYHNQSHLKDVCLSMTLLLKSQLELFPLANTLSPWKISDHESLTLLLCSICHDLGHDGTTNRYLFELEKKSIRLLQEYLESTSLISFERKAIINTIEPIIMATDPKYLPTLLTKFKLVGENLARSDCMSMLMVEADLLASALPKKGEILGQRLSEEWQLANPEAAASVKTDNGRLQFLEYIRFISPQSQTLAIERIRRLSINKLKSRIRI